MELRIPEVGESVREALVARWLKRDGESVDKDESLCEIETDKITLDLSAEVAGVLRILVPAGSTVAVGTVIAEIGERAVAAVEAPAASSAPSSHGQGEHSVVEAPTSPHARREMRLAGIRPAEVAATGKGGRILPDDVINHVRDRARGSGIADESPAPPASPSPLPGSAAAPAADTSGASDADAPVPLPPSSPGRGEERRAMSPIRRRIAERLVAARQQTAMLTTFAEADLGQVRQLREKYREHFLQRHGRALGLMPFFVRACVQALGEYPGLNAAIDGNDIVYHNYYDLGIAVGAEKGLVVPVLRNADQLRLVEIDRAIADFVDRIRHNRLSIADLEGGTFTISNGGVYGSLLSTPLLNPPQSGILGMHAIQERPVARDGRIVIRPMMYLALSYDHRIVDGREAVGFLRRVKEYVEEPEELLLEG